MAIVLPLGLIAKIMMVSFIGVPLVFWVAVKRCCCRGGGTTPEEPRAAAAEPVEPKAPKKKAPRRVFCDAGAQGPVHYNGERYIHKTQGFRRADEVTREVAPSGYRIPPGWEGTARPGPREHHE